MSNVAPLMRLVWLEMRRQRIVLVPVIVTLLVILVALKMPLPDRQQTRELMRMQGLVQEGAPATPLPGGDPAATPSVPGDTAATPPGPGEPEPATSTLPAPDIAPAPTPTNREVDRKVKELHLGYVRAATSLFRTIAIFLALVIGANLIAEEIEKGTILLLATKPVRRSTILLGKLLGVVCFLAATLLLWGLIFGSIFSARVLDASLLVNTMQVSLASIPAPLLMLAIVATFSTVVGNRLASALGLAAWFLGNITPRIVSFFERKGLPAEFERFRWIGDLAHAVTVAVPKPRLDRFADSFLPRHTGEISGGSTVVHQLTTGQLLAALAAIVAWVALAVYSFERRKNLV